MTGPPTAPGRAATTSPLHPPRHRGGRDRLGSRDQRPARRRAAQFGRAQSPAPVGQPRRRDHRHRYQKRRPAGQNGSPRLRSPAVPPLAAERDPWRAGRRPHGTFQDEPGTTRPGKYATVEYAIVPASSPDSCRRVSVRRGRTWLRCGRLVGRCRGGRGLRGLLRPRWSARADVPGTAGRSRRRGSGRGRGC